ncbi:uncharacterized protein B0P05DRAFT_527918 [Gilbertella persicaria]|uniref:uncharacterized protein n=1 Tax=Gilbertella persicaria TaxID=101096 RepID=UPI0022200B0E|nr:uncharacterized protein B0P05DRAFT_527918 [Gilbertella persicaria]KAI8090907.1 hypothetical protein B0P05DRAFT_527918 [Gilbertella persicaria]
MFMKKHAQDDDFESPRKIITESNVDYLSYKFDEMDLAASWRVLTKQKMTIVNGIRLENASWRTWAKQRNNLKTVSPETLNWLKDSDVTWLYGPLHTVIKDMDEQDRYAKPKVSTTEDTLGLMTQQQQQQQPQQEQEQEPLRKSTPEPTVRPNASPLQNGKPLKSALKKVTMSDILKRSVSELQIHNEPDKIAGISISEANQQLGAFSPAVIASHRQPKLRFNQYVEQCVALSSSSEDGSRKKTSRMHMAHLNDETTTNDEYDDDEYDPGEDSDAGSLIMMRKPSRMHSSIKKIEPALLKTNSRSEDSVDSDTSENEIIPTCSHHSFRHKKHRHRSHKTHHNHHEDWDAESAESDAFVNHIIQVSKGKQPIPIDSNTTEWNQTYEQSKSDYDYVFDDDDWDTHSEHMDDFPPSSSSSIQICKAPAVSQTTSPSPRIEKSKSNTTAAEDIHSHQQSNSLLNSIANWASSHIWPSDKHD